MKRLDFWKECSLDFYFFAKHCLRIRVNTPGGWEYIPFVPNAEQRDLHERVLKDFAEKRPSRYLICKGRKLGYSTYIQALSFWLCTFKQNWQAMVVAHQSTATAKIAQISTDFVDLIMTTPFKEIGCKKVRGGVVWPNHSSLELYTARSSEAPRGASPALIHISEMGLMDVNRAATTAEDVLQSFMGTQSYTANTICIIESTAKGADNCFFERWENAQQPGSIWTPIFSSWWQASTPHVIPDPSDTALEAALEAAQGDAATVASIYSSISSCKELVERAQAHGISPAQLRWAHAQWDAYGQQISKFLQEHPFTARDAFVSSGSHVVPESTLHAITVISPKRTSGQLVLPEDYVKTAEGYPVLHLDDIDSPGSDWYFFENPPPRPMQDQFVLGVDTSGGGGGDNAAIFVLDRLTNKQVAQFYANDCIPERLADQVWAASILYGAVQYDHVLRMAHVVPEINGPGGTVVAALVRQRHDNLYRRRLAAGAVNADERQWGYDTNVRTRPILLSRFLELINKSPDIIKSGLLKSELSTFTRDKKGKLDHAPGKCSDAIISAALAFHGHERLPPPSKPGAQTNDWGELDHQVDMFNGGGRSSTYFPD